MSRYLPASRGFHRRSPRPTVSRNRSPAQTEPARNLRRCHSRLPTSGLGVQDRDGDRDAGCEHGGERLLAKWRISQSGRTCERELRRVVRRIEHPEPNERPRWIHQGDALDIQGKHGLPILAQSFWTLSPGFSAKKAEGTVPCRTRVSLDRSALFRERSRGPRFRFFEMGPDVLHNPSERLRRFGVRMFDDERPSRVPADHDPRIEWNPTEKGEAEFLRSGLAASDLEDVGLLAAVGTYEAAHVLDHAQDVHLHGPREGDRLANV